MSKVEDIVYGFCLLAAAIGAFVVLPVAVVLACCGIITW